MGFLALLYVDFDTFAPLLCIPTSAQASTVGKLSMMSCGVLLVAYYTMVASICQVCLATYSEPNPAAKKPRRTVITFGTYDLFHYGHLRILERSAAYGDRLVVGISSDKLNYSKKQQVPALNQDQRMAIVKALGFVDEVFFEEMLEGVCDCEYLARTAGVSSTMIKRHLSKDTTSSGSDGEDSEYTMSECASHQSLTDLGRSPTPSPNK